MSKKDTDLKEDGTILVTYREDEGEVDRRRLAGIMGAATTAMMVLLIVTFSLGMVGAAMGVGLGGFVANFDKVETGGNASIYPVLGEQAACEQAPQLEAKLAGQANITSINSSTPAVEFFKDLPLPGGDFYGGDYARVTIAGNEVNGTEAITATGLDLRLTALEADVLDLGGGNIAEFSTDTAGDNPEDSYANEQALGNESNITANDAIGSGAFQGETEFGISSSSFAILNGTAAAHQVAFDGIKLGAVNLGVQIINNSDNAVVDPSTPGDSDCTALSDYAEFDDQPYTGENTNVTNTNEAGIALDDGTNVTEDDGDGPRGNNGTI